MPFYNTLKILTFIFLYKILKQNIYIIKYITQNNKKQYFNFVVSQGDRERGRYMLLR